MKRYIKSTRDYGGAYDIDYTFEDNGVYIEIMSGGGYTYGTKLYIIISI